MGGRPSEALSILVGYRSRFPTGVLAEEADAVRTMAYCRQAPTRAQARGQSFVERYPRSLFRTQVIAARYTASG